MAETESWVFLNFPYDRTYEPVAIAMMTCLVAVGRTPKAAVEASPGQERLSKIIDLIRKSPVSLHDLSLRAEPRLNMPFELGVACANRHENNPDHEIVIFETEAYRLQRTLSDLNGFDPVLYDGQATVMLKAILEVFASAGEVPELAKVIAVHRKVRKAVLQIKRREHKTTIFDAHMWRLSVGAMVKVSVEAGLL